jgi:hypothetical protein
MIWHYDHRFGTYAGVDSRTSTQTPTPTLEQYQNPNFQIRPWYWVEKTYVNAHTVDNWFIGFRDITNSTNERTVVVSIIPLSAVSNKMPVLQFDNKNENLLLYANLASSVFDYIPRQKIGGTTLNFFYFKQFPALSIDLYSDCEKQIIIPHVLELVYNSWDIKSFSDDIWKEADEVLKIAIREQWEENKTATGGHGWDPPEWCEIDPDGCPLPPFKWDEDRRAILKAELDAIYARLYGLNRKQLRYILDPADLTPRELENILDPWEEVTDPLDPEGYLQRSTQSTFPGETFRVLKEKDIRQFGEYRTRRLVLEAWERLKTKL